MTTRSRSAIALSMIAACSLALGACSEKSDQATDAGSDIQGLSGTTGKLIGEGASSQQKAMGIFRTRYQNAVSGASFDYTATGSGAGQKQFIAGTVDFGGSDSPLKDEQIPDAEQRCGGNPVWHLPMVIGPVAIAYNLPSVDSLNLTPDVAADIFSGAITTWDDPAIAALNPDATLPSENIRVIYRSEESGTSDNFQKFLKAATGGKWATTGKAFPQDIGAGANGSKGVTQEVTQTEGAITYVEAGFVKDTNAKIANVDFGEGPVELNAETVGVALNNLKYKGEGHNMVVDAESLFKMKEKGAYPLVLTTYELVCSKGYDEETKNKVKDFLTVALDSQDQELADAGYIPVSGDYKQKLQDAVDAIQ